MVNIFYSLILLSFSNPNVHQEKIDSIVIFYRDYFTSTPISYEVYDLLEHYNYKKKIIRDCNSKYLEKISQRMDSIKIVENQRWFPCDIKLSCILYSYQKTDTISFDTGPYMYYNRDKYYLDVDLLKLICRHIFPSVRRSAYYFLRLNRKNKKFN